MRERLTFANLMSCVAVFIALGGSALALKANSVGSRAIKNDAVKGRDVKNESLKGADLETNAIGSREIEEAAFDLEPFVKLGSTSNACNPESVSFVPCGSLTLGPTEPSQALVTAGGTQSGAAGATGECRLTAPGTDNLADASVGDPAGRAINAGNGFAITAATDPARLLSPGPNTFRILCNQTSSADVEFSTTLSVVALGGTAG